MLLAKTNVAHLVIATAFGLAGTTLSCGGAEDPSGRPTGGGAAVGGSTAVGGSGGGTSDGGASADLCAGVDCADHGQCVVAAGEASCACDEGFVAEGLLCVDAGPEPLFYDSFESGDMSATNADGFSWGGNNRTSVVNAEGAVWNNGPVDVPKPDGSDWSCFHGEHCLRFRYPALEAWSEQRFDMGNAYPEVWIRYWIRVPHNFVHENPTGSTANNKWFALWMDGYSQHGDGPTVVWNFWPQDGGSSRFTFSLSQEDPSTEPGHHGGHDGFMVHPDDQGRWMQVVLYAKRSSEPGVADGVARIWRRWEGEPTHTLLSESAGRGFSAPPTGPDGWAAGYVMGWSNSGYAEDTEFLLDEFTIATSSLVLE